MSEEKSEFPEEKVTTGRAVETSSESNNSNSNAEEKRTASEDRPVSSSDSKPSETTPKPSETTPKSPRSSETTKISSIRARKRPLEGSSQTVNLSRRDNAAITARRAPQTQNGQPPWAAKPQDVNTKPAWMSDEDFNKIQKHEQPQNPEEPKLKRPSRRGDVHEQSRYARETREIIDRRSEQEKELDYAIRQEIEKKQQNLNQVVRQHYNQRAFQSKRENRNLSSIIKLRNYHAAIKYILINNNTQPGQRVLDLGCGKGGDIAKWEMARVSDYIGIDISNASIVEAVKRYRSRRMHFDVTFITGDCFGQPLPVALEGHPHIRFPVDVVSMQFCMHYAYETEAKARQMLENVARSLGPGGMFIGTIPSSDFIRDKIKHLAPGTKKFGNSIYSVTFLNDLPKDGIFENPYGNVYNYYLKDAIDNVPEYVVPFEAFRALAQEYGLFLKFKKQFAEMFKEEMPTWYNRLSPKIINGMKRSDGKVGLEGEEVEASAFYCAFAFVKT